MNHALCLYTSFYLIFWLSSRLQMISLNTLRINYQAMNQHDRQLTQKQNINIERKDIYINPILIKWELKLITSNLRRWEEWIIEEDKYTKRRKGNPSNPSCHPIITFF